MAFVGKYPLRTKIVLDNNSIEQASHFQSLSCDIFYDVDCDLITGWLGFNQYVPQSVECYRGKQGKRHD